MAMKTRYNVVNGQVLSETRSGVKRDYLTDGLGNTLALLDNTQTKTDTFDYFPSGTVAVRTGATATPFQWVGGQGYFKDSGTRTYVRARNFHNNLGRWGSQDPIGFNGGDFNLYRYVNNRFVIMTDPSGLKCKFDSFSKGAPPTIVTECLGDEFGALAQATITGGGFTAWFMCDGSHNQMVDPRNSLLTVYQQTQSFPSVIKTTLEDGTVIREQWIQEEGWRYDNSHKQIPLPYCWPEGDGPCENVTHPKKSLIGLRATDRPTLHYHTTLFYTPTPPNPDTKYNDKPISSVRLYRKWRAKTYEATMDHRDLNEAKKINLIPNPDSSPSKSWVWGYNVDVQFEAVKDKNGKRALKNTKCDITPVS